VTTREKAPIRFENVELGYGRRTILKNVSFQIQAGDFVGIVGPNGSGKTTLLRCILGWVPARCGRFVRSNRLRFGYVPQRSAIDPLYPLTAFNIVLMGLYATRYPWQSMRTRDREAALKALGQVGLTNKENFLFHQLSGGQQQRVLLARALVGNPDVLILDEPTNGMDLVSEASVMHIIQKIHGETGMTTILVTHLLHVVAEHARTVGLIRGDSIDFGPTKELLTSKHLSELYGTPISVGHVSGKTVVVAE